MKQFSAFLLLLILCAGCKKTTYEYGIVCDFPGLYGGWLVVSNDAGSILKIFDLPAGSTQLVERFEYEARAAGETYNLHLVQHGDSINPLSRVSSYYGVKNGAAVSFSPSILYNSSPAYTYHHLFVRGIPGLDSVDIPGHYVDNYNGLRYDANSKTGSAQVYAMTQAGLVIRVRPHPLAPFHVLYLPPTATDSVELQWTDFLPESHLTTVKAPGDGGAHDLEVAAVGPDFKQCVTLANYDSISPHQIVPNQVPLPDGLPPQSLFRVKLRQGEFTTDKMFLPGEPLRVDPPEIAIQAALFSPFYSLQIATNGSPDLVEAVGYTYGPVPNIFFVRPPSFLWNIQGPPASFVKMQLPDLTELLPELHSLGPQPILWRVTAYKYDYLDYAQLVAGFPYKGGDDRVFPIARAGLQKVTKNY